MKGKTIVIVDPFSSGNGLAPLLKKYYENIVCVISSENLASFYIDSLIKNDFSVIFRLPEDNELFENYLLKNYVTQVVAGSEPGVDLANTLSVKLKCPGHLSNLKEARRNKFEMQNQLKKMNLRSIKQCKVSKISDFEEKNLCLKFTFPLVVKPMQSAGTDGVQLIKCISELSEYFKCHLNTYDIMGNQNSEFLVQEFIDGEEYVVDTVSENGEHFVVAVWKYKKIKCNGKLLYDQMELCKVNDQKNELITYTLKCLTALGIMHGPSHSEIFIDDRGVVLCETGARIHGGKGPLLAKMALGFNQVEMTAHLLNGFLVKSKLKEYLNFNSLYATEVFGQNFKVGPLMKEYTPLFPLLSTFFLTKLLGSTIEITIDLISSPSRLLICGSNKDLIEQEIANFRKWELEVGYV